MDKKQLEAKYIQVKAEIKAHMTMIKMYADNIQQSRSKLDELGEELTALQQAYKELVEGEANESINSESEQENSEQQEEQDGTED